MIKIDHSFIHLRFPKFVQTSGPVVQMLDRAIHRTNLYPEDKAIIFPNAYPLDSDLSSRQCYPMFEQLGPGKIHL